MAGGQSQGPGTKSPVKIVANIFISFIGAGILGLPFGFKEAGLFEAFLVMIFIGIISIKAMFLLIDCKHRIIHKNAIRHATRSINKQTSLLLSIKDGSLPNNQSEDDEIEFKEIDKSIQVADLNMTYGDLGFYAVGTSGRILVEVSIVSSQIGFCCAYLIFISENMNTILGKMLTIQWLGILLPPAFGLTLFRTMKKLAFTSLLAQASTLMAFSVVFWFDFSNIIAHFSNMESPKEICLQGLPFVFALSVYCFEGAGLILSLENSLHESIRDQFKWYFKITIAFVVVLYLAFGAAGYISFGEGTSQIITLNLPHNTFSALVKLFLCMAQFFTYPLMMFPVLEILERRWLPDGGKTKWHGNLLRGFLVCLTGLIVLAVPNFSTLMALIGSTCCMLLGFVLPGLFHWMIFRDRLTSEARGLDIFMILLGIICAILGTLDALKRAHAHHAGPDLTLTTNLWTNVTSSSTAAVSTTTTLATTMHRNYSPISPFVPISEHSKPLFTSPFSNNVTTDLLTNITQ